MAAASRKSVATRQTTSIEDTIEEKVQEQVPEGCCRSCRQRRLMRKKIMVGSVAGLTARELVGKCDGQGFSVRAKSGKLCQGRAAIRGGMPPL